MQIKSNLDKLPSRIKYYLLDWKDMNMEEYVSMFSERKLKELTHEELCVLFRYVTQIDSKNLNIL